MVFIVHTYFSVLYIKHEAFPIRNVHFTNPKFSIIFNNFKYSWNHWYQHMEPLVPTPSTVPPGKVPPSSEALSGFVVHSLEPSN